MAARSSLAIPWLGAVLGGLAVLALTATLVGIPRSFADPDESAHYVNALFLGDWLRVGLPPPMASARDFYAHFPKLSIGHWPPGWYALLAPGFALLRPSPVAAFALSAFIAGLPAGLVLWGATRAGCPRIGAFAAAAYLMTPLAVDGARHFLLDQPVALVIGLGAIAWARAAERSIWPRLLSFAALAAAAPLIKGNGALIMLVPAIDMAIGKRWWLLGRPALWISAAGALAVVAPWYWLSFRIAAGGFNFAPGPGYAWLALKTNVSTVTANVGLCGLALAVAGVWSAWLEVARRPETARVAALASAVILATLVFQSAVPAALEPRYMTPLLPWLVLLEAFGVAALWRGATAARVLAVGLATVALVTPIAGLARLKTSSDIDAPDIAAEMRAHPGAWLVDGRSGDEGAVIAEAAYADAGAKRIWVARASQWLSTSDFMGRNYHSTARTPAEARAVVDRLGIVGIVSIREHDRFAYAHSAPLAAVALSPGFRSRTVPFRSGDGKAVITTRLATVDPDQALLRSGPGSTGLAALARAQR